jgi:hypothetical protein
MKFKIDLQFFERRNTRGSVINIDQLHDEIECEMKEIVNFR